MASDLPSTCPVCHSPGPAAFGTWGGRGYWRCNGCAARGLNPAHYPDGATEKAEYDHHENHVDDPGYRRFLSKLAGPLRSRLAPGAQGLDYGCGPGPALAAMLREAGFQVALYDPIYSPDTAPLSKKYDFVTCTEVIEHFHDPAQEFDRLGALLRPGGWLGLMTCFQTDDARFVDWQYRKDPTHVVFYRAVTLRHVAAARGWSGTIPCKDVALMQTPAL
jgi:SAM-dependent methyltransferase